MDHLHLHCTETRFLWNMFFLSFRSIFSQPFFNLSYSLGAEQIFWWKKNVKFFDKRAPNVSFSWYGRQEWDCLWERVGVHTKP